MDSFKKFFPENLYHSYVIEGNPNETVFLLRDFLLLRNDINQKSIDLMFNTYDSFTIEDSYIIKDWHKNKPLDDKKKICIIGAKFINHEAEQTLLKIIEEPKDNTHFFIIVPDSSLLLGTILSRVHLIRTNDEIDEKEALEFISLKPEARIEKIGELVKRFKDSDGSGGLRYEAINLINGLEKVFYKKWKSNVKDENIKFILNEFKNCRDFLGTPGASVKMILEHISLVI